MKKRIIAMLLCLSMVGAAVGCGKKETQVMEKTETKEEASKVDESDKDESAEDTKESEESEEEKAEASADHGPVDLSEVYVTEYSKDNKLFISDDDEFYRNLLLTSADAELELKQKGETLDNLSKIWNEKIDTTVAALNASPNLTAEDKDRLDGVMTEWKDFEVRFHRLWNTLYNPNGYIHGSMYTDMMTSCGATKYELFEGSLMALEYEVCGSNDLKLGSGIDQSALDSVNPSQFNDYDVCFGIEKGNIEIIEETGILDMTEHEYRNFSADLAAAMAEIGSEDSDGKPYAVNYVLLTKRMNELEAGICEDADKADAIREHRFRLLAAEMMNYVLLMANDSELFSGEPVRDEELIGSDGECYHFSLQRPYDKEGEYRHFYDGFFIDGNYIGVFYASKSDDMDSERYVWDACDFGADLVDVTFDGNKDLLISLGHSGVHGELVYCAYVYEDGQYVYKKSFEKIYNYSLDPENKTIKSTWHSNAATTGEATYIYEHGEFVEG